MARFGETKPIWLATGDEVVGLLPMRAFCETNPIWVWREGVVRFAERSQFGLWRGLRFPGFAVRAFCETDPICVGREGCGAFWRNEANLICGRG